MPGDWFQPGRSLSAADLNRIVAQLAQVITGTDGITVCRSQGRISLGLSRRDRGILPWPGNSGEGAYGTFVSAVASGTFPADTAWTDTNIGLSATAKAFLLGVSADYDYLDFATYTSRDAAGGPFFIRLPSGYNSLVAPVSGHVSGGRVLTRATTASGIYSWTCLGYWT